MRIALAQIAPRLGDVEKNLDLHLEYVGKAKKEKAGLLVFPELSLTGYTLKDLVQDVALDPSDSPVFRKLGAESRDLAIVVGFVEEKAEEKGLFYNSAAFLYKGNILHIHRKVFLPTFGMFEEGKFFAPGRNFNVFAGPLGRTGLLICRDFLQYGSSYVLHAGGAEIFLVVSAAPGRGISPEARFETSRMWELMGEAISYFSTAYVIYCNRVGFEDGKTFAGGSFIFNPRGELQARCPEIDPAWMVEDIHPGLVRDIRRKRTFKRDDRPEIILHSLERTVSRYED
ncbi:MAG: hypothetical protein PHX45_05745 [Acidobacteriota bacterium]|nr:hypothetical protein [Acidobacteriota bacterium]